MNAIDPCNDAHVSNFLKNYTEEQVNKLLEIHKELLKRCKSTNNIQYSTDDIWECIDPIR